MKKKYLLILMLIIFVGIMNFAIFKIGCWFIDNNSTRKLIIEVQKDIDVVVTDDLTIEVDYSKAAEINNDIIGWIKVNGTNINYPFVQYTDNEFYLKHSLDKSYNAAGWVFLDYRNNINEKNKNLILYGHGRLDGTMFGSLRNVLSSSWQNKEENHIINLSTRSGSYLYQVFSVYHIPTNSDYIQTDFSDNQEFLEFIDTITKRSIYDFNTNVDSSDSILTLSTCYQSTEKIVVHAKLIS